MGRIRSTPLAKRQIKSLWRYIAADSPAAADRLLAQLRGKIAAAADRPGMGMPRPDLGETTRVLVHGSYLVLYDTEPGGIVVVAVVHGMRNPRHWLD